MGPKVAEIFAEVLGLPEANISDDFSPATSPEWDSLQSMNLVIALEDAFAVKFSTREIASMQSVGLVKQALRSRGIDAA
jgi:acyl carrier protein